MCRFVPLGAVQGAGTQSSPKALKGGPLVRGETLKCVWVEPRGHRNVAEQLLLRRSDPKLGRSHAITLRSGDTKHLVDEGNWPKKRKMLEVGSPAWKNLLWKKLSHPETAFCLRFGAVGVGNWGVRGQWEPRGVRWAGSTGVSGIDGVAAEPRALQGEP